jgi:hypothetical protein
MDTHATVEELLDYNNGNGVFYVVRAEMLSAGSVEFRSYTRRGGGFEYIHRSPASRRRWRKGNSVPEGITGPPCSWGI